MQPPTKAEIAARLRELGYTVDDSRDREYLLDVLVKHVMGWCLPMQPPVQPTSDRDAET